MFTITGTVIYILILLLMFCVGTIGGLKRIISIKDSEIRALEDSLDGAKSIMESYSNMMNELLDNNERLQKELDDFKKDRLTNDM